MTNTAAVPARHIAIYTRISQDKERDQRAVARQKRDCEVHIKKLIRDGIVPSGLRVEHYSDNSESAFKENQRAKRTEFARMLDDADAGYVEAIVAYHSDRLYRRVPDLYDVARAVKKNDHLTVQTVKSGSVDFSTPVGRLAAVMLAAIAEYEVEIKSVRQMSESDQIAATGDPRRGGRRPFGYDKDVPGKKGKYVVIRKDEADEIRNATKQLLNGKSVTSIVKDWNARGVLTVQAQMVLARRESAAAKIAAGLELTASEVGDVERLLPEWHHSNFVALMLRYRNAGIRQHRGRPIGKATWPAIVEETDFEDVRKVLLDPSRLKSPDKTRKHLLSFIVSCARCEVGMRAAASHVPYTPVGGVKRYRRYMHYQCPGHKATKDDPCRLSITYDVAETAVKAYIAERLTTPDPELLAVHSAERGELRLLRRRRADLDADERVIERAKISLTSRTRQLESIHAERLRIDAQVVSIGQRVALAALLAEAAPPVTERRGYRVSFEDAAVARAAAMAHFETLRLEQRRDIVRALCAVVIEPSKKGVSYKFGRAFERVLIYPKNPVTGEVSGEPLRGSQVVGFRDGEGRMRGFVYDERSQ